MGGGSFKSSEVVKANDFNQSSLKDESFSVVNLHMRGIDGAHGPGTELGRLYAV